MSDYVQLFIRPDHKVSERLSTFNILQPKTNEGRNKEKPTFQGGLDD